MRKLIVVTGYVASGKSTVAEILGQLLLAPHLSVGQIIRDYYSIGEDDANPSANNPQWMAESRLAPEAFMRNLVEVTLRDMNDDIIVLDGTPRIKEQIGWIEKVASDRDMQIVYVAVITSVDTSFSRSVSRARFDAKYDMARIELQAMDITKVIKSLNREARYRKLEFYEYHNDESKDKAPMILELEKIAQKILKER